MTCPVCRPRKHTRRNHAFTLLLDAIARAARR